MRQIFTIFAIDMDKIKKLISILSEQAADKSKEQMELFVTSDKIGRILKAELAKMPLHINVIAISAVGKLKETAHSSVLQHLLKNQAILDSFMNQIIGISNCKVSSKKVRTAEQDRIDVSIFDERLCVIIENKVNDAVEQPGQIYRYVQKAKEIGYGDHEIKVLYLNSSHHYIPSDFSLTKDGNGVERISPEIERNIIVKDYAHDIYEWVCKLPNLLPDNEKFLHSAILQYQDYLEEYFHITDKFKNMKDKIRKTIISEILSEFSDENDINYSKRIERLEETSANLQELLGGVNELINELSICQIKLNSRRVAEPIKQELKKFGYNLINLSDFGYTENNYGVRISINGKIGYIVYGYAEREYIGFAFDTYCLTKAEKDALGLIFNKFGKENAGEEPRLVCWQYIGCTSLLDAFLNFVLYVRNFTNTENKCAIRFE